jgi:DNA-directed RNA polymerase alpha subunit
MNAAGYPMNYLRSKMYPLYEIGFSVRVENALRRSGINSLKELVLCSRCDLLRVRNLGKKGRAELEALLLDKYGVTLREGLKI